MIMIRKIPKLLTPLDQSILGVFAGIARGDTPAYNLPVSLKSEQKRTNERVRNRCGVDTGG